MPKELPYMKWYPADFEEDEDVKLMTLEEVGFYVRCMNHAWNNNGLPGNVEMVARLFHLDFDKAERLWSIVGKKFFLHEGRFFNRRQEIDRANALEVSSKRAAIGKMGAQAKHKQLPGEIVAIAKEEDGNTQSFASVRAYESVSVSKSSSSSCENLKSPPAESSELAATFGRVSNNIHQRHPAKRRDLTPWQIEANLRLILTCHRIRADPEKVFYLQMLDQRHGQLCESSEWKENSGRYAKSLRNWLKPEDGLYDIEPDKPKPEEQELSLDQKAALQRYSHSSDPGAEYQEFMARMRQQRVS
jgi:uncharacterized protein YdaU (DUF1376 family)